MSIPKPIYENGDYVLLEYIPTLFHLLYIDFEPMHFIRRMRFVLEYLRKGKYKVYYLKVKGRMVGHCVITPGGRRLKCSGRHDIVIGPYYIKESERGKGYGKEIMLLSLDYCSIDYKNAYCWIDKTNTPSIKAAESCGFKKIAELNVVKPFRKLVIVENGEDNIYKYRKKVKCYE